MEDIKDLFFRATEPYLVELYLSQYPELVNEISGKENMTKLMQVITDNSLTTYERRSLVSLLSKYNPDLSMRNTSDNSAVHFAVWRMDFDILQKISNLPSANFLMKGWNSKTPIYFYNSDKDDIGNPIKKFLIEKVGSLEKFEQLRK